MIISFLYATFPNPIKGKNRCDNGAKSPEAPTEPWEGTMGMASFSMCQIIRSKVFKAIPENPLAKDCALRISISFAISFAIGSPTPTL